MRTFVAYDKYIVSGSDEDIVAQLKKLQFIDNDDDIHEFMMGFSNRAWAVADHYISADNACDFVSDLIHYGYLKEVEFN